MSAQSPSQLSPLDGSFLRLDTPQAHMHVGFSAVFSAPGDGAARPTLEALRERVARRLPGVPWCRWRLQDAPLGLSEPRWVEDPDFDLDAHVIGLTGPEDAVSLEAFEALRDSLLSAPLDRSRPLWQVALIPQLEDGRVGMIGKIHHSLVDGFAALQLVALAPGLRDEGDSRTATLDAEAPPDSSDPPVRKDPLCMGCRRAPANRGRGTRRGPRGRSGGPSAASQVSPPPSRRSAAWHRPCARICYRRRPLRLNVPIGARRTLASYRAPRAQLRDARSRGGTLNDVGLALGHRRATRALAEAR